MSIAEKKPKYMIISPYGEAPVLTDSLETVTNYLNSEECYVVDLSSYTMIDSTGIHTEKIKLKEI